MPVEIRRVPQFRQKVLDGAFEDPHVGQNVGADTALPSPAGIGARGS